MFSYLCSQLILSIETSLNKSFPSLETAPPVTLEIPHEKQHGEFSSNIAMRLAKPLKKNPLELAALLKEAIQKEIGARSLAAKIHKVDIQKPGFINFYLSQEAFYDTLAQVLKQGPEYGDSDFGQHQRVQIEFVSANPTGPLSVAHARQAAVGDALGNILQHVGFDVTKEFYVNDEGNQINLLGQSIACRGQEILGQPAELPENGYQGDYIKDIAQQFLKEKNINSLEQFKAEDNQIFAQYGADHLLEIIKQELNDFGVVFDVWSHQSQIATSENIQTVLSSLKDKGFIYEKEGAVWFKSTEFGDDKDRVVKKNDGSYTYLTPDIVYHKDKFERGFQRVFNIWGPDHHGYIPRIKASAQALGQDPDSLQVLIVQLATIFKGGQPLSMSTRKGQYISLREVMDEVGVDAARFFFLMRHIKAHLDFDLELAKKQTSENPVYYVQYAHARINSILNKARETQLEPMTNAFSQLKEVEEFDLIRKIGLFPGALLICAKQMDPYALVNYLQELASVFHKFYDSHQVVGDDSVLSGERLGLIEATKIVLANGLHLLGITAPEKM